jgi:hypothetical protein
MGPIPVLFLGLAAAAAAQPLEQAKQAFDAGDYHKAIRLFEQSQQQSQRCEVASRRISSSRRDCQLGRGTGLPDEAGPAAGVSHGLNQDRAGQPFQRPVRIIHSLG